MQKPQNFSPAAGNSSNPPKHHLINDFGSGKIKKKTLEGGRKGSKEGGKGGGREGGEEGRDCFS